MNLPRWSAGFLALAAVLALLAPVLSLQDPLDPLTYNLADGLQPPLSAAEGGRFLLGTDPQGRDLVSVLLHGLRLSMAAAALAVTLALLLGATLGLAAGWAGGLGRALVLRAAEVQLTFPAILVAILFNGLIRAGSEAGLRQDLAFPVVVLAIALAAWPQYALVACRATGVEAGRDYVLSARLMGLPARLILWRHVLPNIRQPLLVLAALDFATAVIAEATLSFLGQGMPPSTPSLGGLIRVGHDHLYSGAWWIFAFPALALCLLVLAVTRLGEWLRQRGEGA